MSRTPPKGGVAYISLLAPYARALAFACVLLSAYTLSAKRVHALRRSGARERARALRANKSAKFATRRISRACARRQRQNAKKSLLIEHFTTPK